MSIKQINFDCIDVIGGGYRDHQMSLTNEDIRNILGRCITAVADIEDLNECSIPIKCGDLCVTRCIPNKKPEKCSYAAWGMLHDIDEGLIQKCKE